VTVEPPLASPGAAPAGTALAGAASAGAASAGAASAGAASAGAAGDPGFRWVGVPLRVVRGQDRATIEGRNEDGYDGLLITDSE
jgi:hypothetical protein